MTIKSLRITDGTTNTSSYSYADQTGTHQSIKAITGQSEAYKAIKKKTSAQQMRDNWNALSTGAKIGIACAVAGVLLIMLVAFTIFCVKQRRAGKAEKAIHDKEWDEHHAELVTYRTKMARGDFAVSHMGHGELKY